MRRVAIAAAAVFALLEVAPYLVMLSGSLKTLEEVSRVPPTVVPESAHPENYSEVFEAAPMARYLANTVIVSGSIALAQIVLVVLAAYALTFMRMGPSARAVQVLVLLCLAVPPQVRFVPVYLMLARVDLVDTFFALVAPHAASALGILLACKAMRALPIEVVEAARLDGASELAIAFRVVAPMIRPTLVAFLLFSVVYHWNDYFWTLVMTTSDRVRTLPVGVALLREQGTGVRWHLVMAATVVVTAPVLAIFALTNRHLVRAFTWTSPR
ncbi:MAG: carbohydrate ABC transporter permease [Deltaproteobacteria bacterium]|nr:carbohydrate ABC transporter permease [Deltaproteobacteria bacterium]